MSEKFSGEKGFTPENPEDQKQEAEAELNRIKRDIDHVFTSTPNREEADKIVEEKWLPLMEEAKKRLEDLQAASGDNEQKKVEQETKESN